MSLIEQYSFGKITIDGKDYTDDVILLGKRVLSRWWRVSGHGVSRDDLKDVIEYGPDIFVIGTGNSGRMQVPSELVESLVFEVESYPTKKACRRYNELLETDSKVACGLHLTC